MSKIVAILTTAAALMVAAPASAQDKSSNTFGGASFESVPNSYEPGYGYETAPARRVVRTPVMPRAFITVPQRESGRSKRS